jgi:hypothetical protein
MGMNYQIIYGNMLRDELKIILNRHKCIKIIQCQLVNRSVKQNITHGQKL